MLAGAAITGQGVWLLHREHLTSGSHSLAVLVTVCGVAAVLVPVLALCFPQPRRP